MSGQRPSDKYVPPRAKAQLKCRGGQIRQPPHTGPQGQALTGNGAAAAVIVTEAFLAAGPQHDFDHTVFLVAEFLVHGRRIFEACRMRNDEARVDLAIFDQLILRMSTGRARIRLPCWKALYPRLVGFKDNEQGIDIAERAQCAVECPSIRAR
jgi:hypothetical protein